MKHYSFIIGFLALACVTPVSANSQIKIDTIPSEYAPINSPTNREPVSMSSYHFEVNQETGRARVVVEYTYPDQMTYGPEDDAGGPPSTVVQLPGLRYDSGAHAVVFDSNGVRSVCAIVNERSTLFGHQLKVKNTGTCTVATVVAAHTKDTGWDIHRLRAIDIYFEVH
jgi:hypothetical protein